MAMAAAVALARSERIVGLEGKAVIEVVGRPDVDLEEIVI